MEETDASEGSSRCLDQGLLLLQSEQVGRLKKSIAIQVHGGGVESIGGGQGPQINGPSQSSRTDRHVYSYGQS